MCELEGSQCQARRYGIRLGAVVFTTVFYIWR